MSNPRFMTAAEHHAPSDFICLNPLANPPEAPTEGMIYESADDHHLYFYNGSEWKQLVEAPPP